MTQVPPFSPEQEARIREIIREENAEADATVAANTKAVSPIVSAAQERAHARRSKSPLNNGESDA